MNTSSVTAVGRMASKPELPQMMAIVKLWSNSELHGPRDNTLHYVFLMLCKLALDAGVLFLCRRRRRVTFGTVCGFSLVMADALLLGSLATVWFLGPAKSPVTLCFLLAHGSTTYSALPLPVLGLTLLLDNVPNHGDVETRPSRTRKVLRVLRDCALVLVVWVLAGLCCTSSNLLDLELSGGQGGATRALVCPVQESALVTGACLGLSLAACCVLLPHCSKLPCWYREANRLAVQRDSSAVTGPSSDLLFVHNFFFKENRAEVPELVGERPRMGVSMTMAFVSVWMPYLMVSSACFLLGYGVPANVQVNLLWLECSNSLLAALWFWLRSNRLGPYCQPYDKTCMYSIYWHLSQEPGSLQRQEKQPLAVVSSSEGDIGPLVKLL